MAAPHGLPVAAIGNVCMHVRSRKPLQDTLTAIRLGKPVAECGYELAQNAEQHLRARLRLANLYPPGALAETLRSPAGALSPWMNCATNIPTSWCRRATHRPPICAGNLYRRHAVSRGIPPRCKRRSSTNWR